MDETKTKEYLIENNVEFRQLFEEHQTYEKKLDELIAKPFLSSEEQMEETIIKKKKLALKDQMQMLIYQHRSSAH